MQRLLLLILMASCAGTKTPAPVTINSSAPNSEITVIPFSNHINELYRLFEGAEPTELTEKELALIDQLLSERMKAYNMEKATHINLKEYKRQYVPVINSAGEKEVWVNCFCEEWPGWETDIVSVLDGGNNCYFNIKFNLNDKTSRDLLVN